MEKLLLVIKQVIEPFTKDILITTHYLMVLVVVIRKLRHRGKKRHTKDYVENRGKISISHTIQERPKDANNRTRIGGWEDDTVAGKTGKSCLVTLTDRYYRFLKIQKVAVKKSKLVIEAMVKMLEPLTKHTVTPDRGKEFTYHQKLCDQLKIEVYFPDPHAPWQRGTNENTNGLLREHFPKESDVTLVNDQIIQLWKNKLNNSGSIISVVGKSSMEIMEPF